MGAGCGGELRRMAGRLANQFRLSFGMALGMVPVSLLLPPPLALVAGFLGWIVIYGRAFEDDSDLVAGWGWLTGFIGPLSVCMGFADYATAQFGPIVRDAAVAEARLHPAGSGFEFAAAVVRVEFATTARVTNSSGKSSSPTTRTYTVAPLTPPDWRPGEPVPAWVGCADDACRGWRGGRAAFPAPWFDGSGLATAVRRAQERHGLASLPDAPVLELHPSLAAGRWSRGGKHLTGLVVGYLAWALPVMIGGFWGALVALARGMRAG